MFIVMCFDAYEEAFVVAVDICVGIVFNFEVYTAVVFVSEGS